MMHNLSNIIEISKMIFHLAVITIDLNINFIQLNFNISPISNG